MPLPWPPAAPPDESTELAALRTQFLRGTPEQTLLAILRNASLDYTAHQGQEGGRVVFVGAAVHAGLFASACEAIRANSVTQQQIDDIRAAALAVRNARATRDALLAALPIDLQRRLKAEAEAT